MKPNQNSFRRVVQKLGCLTLVFLGLCVQQAHAAAGPSVTNVLTNVRIFDNQSTNLYDSAGISEGSTNILTVYVDFAPTNYGTLLPLPPGVTVQNGTNYVFSATNGTLATATLQQFTFTPVENLIPVPEFSNATFHVYVTDAANNTSLTRTTTVRITSTNDPNAFTASSSTNITDKQTALPFRNTSVTDVDDQGDQPQDVTVTINGSNHGYLIVTNTSFTSNNLAYTFTGTPSQVTNELAGLVFVPKNNFYAPATTDIVSFRLLVSDGYVTRTNNAVTVSVLSTNDAPTVSGSGTFNITDKQTVKPFTNIVIADPDLSATQAQAVTITLSDTNGYLDIGSTGFASNNLAYTFAGTPAAATAAMSNLVYIPLENFLPVGMSNSTALTIQVNDGFVSRTNSSVTVNSLSTNDVPQLTGVTAVHIPVEIGNTIYPFQFLTFIDPDHNDNISNTNHQDLDWDVTLGGTNPIGQLASGGSPVGTNFSAVQGPVDATASLRDVSYVAPTLAITGTNVLKLIITAADGHGGTVSNNVYLDLYSLVAPPGLSGMQSGQSVNDNSTIAPFSKVAVQSFNGSAVTLRIALFGVTNDAQGQLINLGSFVRATSSTNTSIYSFTGTSEAATAGIRALLFQPVANRIAGGTTDTARFSITLVDGIFTNAPDNSTTVRIVPVNDTPILSGTSPLVTIQDNETVLPFPTVLITDADQGGQQLIAATISLDVAAKGTFTTNSLTASGFTNNGSSYTFTGTPAALTAAIRQLVFKPTPGRVPFGLTETTVFTIALNDSFGGAIANSATAVRVASVSGLPVIDVPTTQPVSIPVASNIYPFQGVTISDATLLQVAIRINNPAQGAFSTNSVASTGFTNRGGGIYFISGYATNVTAALQQLVFTPAPSLPFGAIINFTISATNALPNFDSKNHAVVLRTVRNSFIVTKRTDYDPNDNTVPLVNKEGTLRKAIADAKNNDHITFDLRSLSNGVPDYPAVIHLKAPLYIYNNLTFDGPGADNLTISGDSDTNGTPDVQLFNVNAAVTMNRLAFTLGYDSFAGGAFEVGMDGDLTLSYCSISDSVADIWGGGIDVTSGKLTMDHCLVRGNSTSTALGGGGGGVSIYTDQACAISHTTFATNRQNAASGYGGGALYAETSDFGVQLNVYLLSCTFRDNYDAANHGSSVRPDGNNNTVVQLQNTIVADGHGRNIEMDQGGFVTSLGGNISDDATATTFSVGGPATNNYIFHPPADQINVPVTNLLALLADNGGPTLTCALPGGSTAVGNAISNTPSAAFYATLGTDQRGYFRDHSPDIGAVERGANQRVIIEEIGFNPAPPNTNDEFIEFYVPRDSAAFNIAGYQVLVDGVLRHTFTDEPLQPGEALVLFSAGAVSTGVPTGVHRQIASSSLLLDNDGGLITLLNPSNQVVFLADYVGAFTSTDPNDYGYLSSNYQSVVLCPQFVGCFLPYQRVVAKYGGSRTNSLSDAGSDAQGAPLAIGNAPPLAYADDANTDAHTPIIVDVLANDVDLDINDTLRVVVVGTNANLGVTGATNYSKFGAMLVINKSPTDGASITYDPTASALLTKLPEGSNVVDSFTYLIQDYVNFLVYTNYTYTNQIYTYTNLAALGTNLVITSTNQILADTNVMVTATNLVAITTNWSYVITTNNFRGTNALDTGSPIYTQNLTKATATVTVKVVGVNSAPTPQDDDVTTRTNLTIREDAILDFTTATNILWNDTDPNTDDDSTTLNIIGICATNGVTSNLVSIVTALGATVTLDLRFDRNETHITYDPRASAILNALGTNQSVNDTFYYTVQDRHNAKSVAAIRILVTGVNDSPTARPNAFATDEDTVLPIPAASLLANATDPDNATVFTVSAVTPVSALGASVQIVGTNIVYDPTISTNLNSLAQKEFATDTFTYTVTDEHGLSSNAVATITVAGVNDHPISHADFYTNIEDTLFTQAAPGVLANDVEPDINGLTPDDSFRVIPFTINTVTNLYTATNGGAPVVMNADGSFTFDPRIAFDWVKQGQTVDDSFDYVVMDHSLSIARDDNFAVNASTTNNVLPVLANDSVLSLVGGAFTLTGVTTPNHGGTVALNATSNAVVYTPLAGYVGPETFSYTVSDGLGGSDTAVVTVNLTAETLFASADAYTVAQGTTNNVFDVLANDVILPATGASVTLTGLGTPSLGGTIDFNGAGPGNRINYTPNPAQPTPFIETFSYVVTSGSLTATGAVSVAVLDRTNVLAANSDTFTVLVGSGNNSFDVLANDVILPGTTTNLFITSFVSNSVQGTVSLNAAHTRLVYKPSSIVTASNNSEHVSYTISDGAGGTASASVTINVVAGGLIANDDTFVIYRGSVSNSLPVMVNDVILPNLGQTLYISGTGFVTNAPVHGSVGINGAGTALIYTPTATSNTVDDFSYEISDGSTARALGHVHLVILDNSLVPSNPDNFRVLRESTTNLLAVLPNDYPLPRTPSTLTVTALITNGLRGTVVRNGAAVDNTLLYTPPAGYIGTDRFRYEVTDNYGNKGTNAVAVTVGDLAPRDDEFSVLSDSATNTLDVLANDYPFPDTNALRKLHALSAPDHGGVVALNSASNAVIYTPAASFTGIEHFTYQLKDDSTNLFTANVAITVAARGSDRETNTVTMTVVGVNDIPTITGAQAGFEITDKQTVHPFTNVVIGDLDEFGLQTNTVTVSLDAAAKGVITSLGGFVDLGDGVYRMTGTPPDITAALKALVFVPTENRIIVPTSETTRFTIVADDGYVLSLVTNSITTVIVTAVNDAPVISGTLGGWQIDDKHTVQPFTNALITEVDDSTLQALTVQVSLDLAAKGILTNLGGFTDSGGGIYTMHGVASNITASLKTLVFVPTENRIIVPTSQITTLTISVNDGFTLNLITNNATTINVTATNDIPVISGAIGGWQIDDKHTVKPFTNVVITEVDDLRVQPLLVAVALDDAAKGTLQNLGGFTNAGGGLYAMHGTASNITASLKQLVFAPTENRIIVPTNETTRLTIFVDDGFLVAQVTNDATTIIVTATNDAPTIAGTGTYNITDKQTLLPFTNLVIADVDNLNAVPPQPQTMTVKIVQDLTGDGYLHNLGGFVQTSLGVFEMSGTPAVVNASIQAMLFVPATNHIIVPTTPAIHFKFSVSDGFVASPTTATTTINVTAINDAPVISGTVSNQLIYNRSTIKPFTSVLITEVDNDRQQVLRVTVTLDSASKGYLSSLGGFTDLGGGVYSLGASNGNVTAAIATTAIRGLVFTPTTASRVTPGAPEMTRFTIRVDDFFALTVVDTNTTVVAIHPLNARVTASDKTVNSQFGWSVATTRDLAAVGAPNDSANTNSGSVYLYARSLDGSNTWTQIKKLLPPDGRNTDKFGTSVAVADDLVFVGASTADVTGAIDAGAVYIYARNQGGADQWGFVKKLTAPDRSQADYFGTSVSISGDTLAVGAYGVDVTSTDFGAAYIFERNQGGADQWGYVLKLYASDRAPGDQFGWWVSLSTNTLVIGAPGADVSGSDRGAAYIFERNQNGTNAWGQVKKLTASDMANSDRFGSSVGIDGDNIVIGSPQADPGGSDRGATYIFARNQGGTNAWGQVKKLTASDSANGDHFGHAVSISGESVVVGAYWADGSGGADYGAAYLFWQNQGGSNQWNQVDKFLPAAVGTSDYFGCAVAVWRYTVVVGAYNTLDSGSRYGAAYMFRVKYNNGPQLLASIADMTVQMGVPFAVMVPPGVFTDSDASEVLSYSFGSSPAAPGWLGINAGSGVFGGTPASVGVYPVVLVASDTDGFSVSNQFTINVVASAVSVDSSITTTVQRSGANQILNIYVSGLPGYTYRLLQATNLQGPVINWTPVATATMDAGGVIWFNYTNPPSPSYFRAVWP